MANQMILGVHENFDNRAITVSTTEEHLTTLKTWLATILPLYPYRPLVSSPESRSNGSLDGISVRTGKYSKLFAPTLETDTTVDYSFDPSTITSVRTPRANPWTIGPPLNVTFDRRASRSVTLNTTPNTRTYSSVTRQPDNGVPMNDLDDGSDSTPLTRPSASTVDIGKLVAQALAAERVKLDRRLSELESKQQAFLESIDKWEHTLSEMRKQIVDATVTGTISVLTGHQSPFATKADTQKLCEDNATNGVTVLQDHMTLLLQCTKQLFAAHHEPDIQSPPRKARATKPALPADSPMTDVEGVGEE